MKARLFRIVGSLAVIITAYVTYALTVVPLVEPSVERRIDDNRDRLPIDRDPKKRLRRQWGRYFAANAWQLQDAKVLESEQAAFFAGDYRNLPDGRVELKPFTALLIPRDQRGSDGQIDPNSNKVIALDAPEGAILQFDEPFDLKRAKISKLMGASLTGPVHIHNAPVQSPGSPNEVDILTRDVQLVGDKIVTPHKVSFRFGPNAGSGRDLKIALTQRGGEDAQKTGVNFDGIRSLELKQEVKVRVVLGNKGLMPGPAPKPAAKNGAPGTDAPATPATASATGGKKKAGTPAAAGTAAKKPDPPVEVTCQGPFLFDVEKSVATFSDRVDVVRLNPVGQHDTMNCDVLAIHFAPREQPTAPDQKPEPEPDPTSKDSLSKLEARLIEARGDPVIVRSPSNGGHVRCERLEYDIRNGNIRLEGQREVLLNQGSNEVRTRQLDYQPATTGRLGRLNCNGPGTLNGAMQDDPTRKYSARWTRQLLMQPDAELHRISLLGGAQMRMSDTGTLTAEEIYVWVSETAQPAGGGKPAVETPRAPAPAKPGAAGPETPGGSRSLVAGAGGIQVERLLAVDRVRIDSPQLTGATRRLEVWFDRPPVAATPPAAPPPAAAGASNPAPAPQAPPPATAASPPKPAAPPANRKPQGSFDVAGNLLRLKVAAPPGGQLAVSEVAVEENARLIETRTAKLGDKPLLVRGQTLHLEQAETPNAHVTVVGKPAYIEARGMTLSGATIQMLRGDNRLWIDGAGKMTLPAKGNLAGGKRGDQPAAPAAAAAPGPRVFAARPVAGKAEPPAQTLEITWQGGMNFDGLQATYTRSVLAHTEHQWLRTDFLAVSLKRRIDFNAPPPADGAGGGGASEVELVDCRGGVLLESRDFDERGLTSVDQMQLHTLWVNQTSGAVEGQGPGWITRVSRGDAAGQTNAKPGAPPGKPAAATVRPAAMTNQQPAAAAKPAKKEDRLTYMHVTFERNLTGNVNHRELTFADQVRTVYGPVPTWQSTLNGDDMRSLGPEGIVMNCDQLTVREMPALVRGERGTMELEATGQTLIEGQTFTAQAHRLTYAQAKDLLIFEGDGRSDAVLYRQLAVGQPMTKATARKIMYWRTANRAEVDDARHLDLGNIPGGPAGKTPSKSQAGFLTPIPGLTTPP